MLGVVDGSAAAEGLVGVRPAPFRPVASLVAALSNINSTSSSSAAGASGASAISSLIDALNFVFELVGATQTYLSVEECPGERPPGDRLRLRLERRVHQDKFFEVVPLLDGRDVQQLRPVDSRPHRFREPRSRST